MSVIDSLNADVIFSNAKKLSDKAMTQIFSDLYTKFTKTILLSEQLII